jgi:hypothetical protein
MLPQVSCGCQGVHEISKHRKATRCGSEPHSHVTLSPKVTLTRAEKAARVSELRVDWERSRNRRDTSRRETASTPQERQMDTALVDHAD